MNFARLSRVQLRVEKFSTHSEVTGMAKEARQQGAGRVSAIRESDLKVCDLCSHLNLNSNPECVVCGWRGHFEQSPEVVHAAVELARRHNRLELQHLADPHALPPPGPLPWRVRVRSWARRLWRWLCG
jgi:hypothetical protein